MRLIIFDVDGTLVDSQHHIVEAQRRAFASLGLEAPMRQRSLSIVGLSLTEAFSVLAGAGGPVEALSEAYKTAWTAMREEPGFTEALYPGAAGVLATLAADPTVTLGIATGKSARGVERLTVTQNWTGLFKTVQTADDHPSKPHPSMILRAMQETGTAPGETAMIGDTTYDMAMAVAAGVRAIGVTWGYHEPHALREAGAMTVVASFAELMAVLGYEARSDAAGGAKE